MVKVHAADDFMSGEPGTRVRYETACKQHGAVKDGDDVKYVTTRNLEEVTCATCLRKVTVGR